MNDKEATVKLECINSSSIMNNENSKEPKRYKSKSKTEFISTNNEENESIIQIQAHKRNSVKMEDDGLGVGMSIRERLAALKKSGEEEWKKRVTNEELNDIESNKINSVRQKLQATTPKLPNSLTKSSSTEPPKRPILAPLTSNNNMAINEDKSTSNQNKTSSSSTSNESLNNLDQINSSQRTKITPVSKRIYFTQNEINSNSSQFKTPILPAAHKPNKIKTTGSYTDSIIDTHKKAPTNGSNGISENVTEKVELFSNDGEEMNSFFKENNLVIDKMDEEFGNDDFDQIRLDAQRLTQTVRAKPSRNTRSKGNHLKNLQQRMEIRNEYEQVTSVNIIPSTPQTPLEQTNRGVANGSLSTAKKNGSSNKVNAGFTDTALAGLAAKEDFSSVKLKRSESISHIEYPPYNDLMLIHVKGRRYCQTRLVEPCIDSLNNGDCFILVAPSRLFLWIGEYANIIEKSKATEIYDWIRMRKDLGINKTQTISAVITSGMAEPNDNMSENEKEFYSLLKSNSDAKQIFERNFQTPDEDEKYELLISDTNIVYKVVFIDGCEHDSDGYSSNESEETINEAYLKKLCLEPLKSFCGSVLSYNMLDEDEVFVFDFGSEVYVWNGRNSSSLKKKVGILLAKKLFESGYDYSNCVITPLKSHINLSTKMLDESSVYFKSDEARPKWTVFGKQSQNVETVLFREKFIDWPNLPSTPGLKKLAYNGAQRSCEQTSEPSTPLIGFKTPSMFGNSAASSPTVKTPNLFNYEPIDGDSLIKMDDTPVNFVLENSNLGRGRHWFDEIERRSFDIVTENVTMFKIIDNQMVECDKSDFGELVDNYTYVIKWHYKINAVGFRTLKGQASQHQGITGRDRYALFFWQGLKASQNEKGASALLSLDISAKNSSSAANLAGSLGSNFNNVNANGSDGSDESSSTPVMEKRNSFPHVQVFQYKETPVFSQLFDGSMIIVSNECDSCEWRMFELRGELSEESHLIELGGVSAEYLRSKTSFLFVNSKLKSFFIWHGCCSNDLQRKLISECANKLAKRVSKRFNFGNHDIQIKEIEEGDETDENFTSMFSPSLDKNATKRTYHSLIDNEISSLKAAYDFTPRLFLMTSLYGQFEAKEILNPLRSTNTSHFPFYQFQLYEEKQPAIFMLDNNNEIFIWQGWFESSLADIKKENSILLSEQDAVDGSTKIRYTMGRKCALQTAINYWKCKYKSEDKPFKGYVVYAGLEPVEFINLFPLWKVNENARNCNLNDGKVMSQKDSIEEVLAQLNRDRYPISVLKKRPLPDGVDPLRLECYLCDEEFEEVLKTTKENFFSLPAWKQTNLKKKALLF